MSRMKFLDQMGTFRVGESRGGENSAIKCGKICTEGWGELLSVGGR